MEARLLSGQQPQLIRRRDTGDRKLFSLLPWRTGRCAQGRPFARTWGKAQGGRGARWREARPSELRLEAASWGSALAGPLPAAAESKEEAARVSKKKYRVPVKLESQIDTHNFLVCMCLNYLKFTFSWVSRVSLATPKSSHPSPLLGSRGQQWGRHQTKLRDGRLQPQGRGLGCGLSNAPGARG